MTMKRWLFPLLFALCGLAAVAQTDGTAQRRRWGDAFMPADTLRAAFPAPVAADSACAELPLSPAAPDFSLLPAPFGYGMAGPGAMGADWRLHEGFNAQLGLSLSVGLGKGAWRGAGFGQTAAFAWLQPLTPRLSVAAGVFAAHTDWGAWRRTDAGIAGMVAYRPADRLTLYAFGSKSFLPRTQDFLSRRSPLPPAFDLPRDRIGAAAEFKIGEAATLGVSVERTSY